MLFDASARGLNCAIYGKTVLELLELGWSVPTFTDAPQEPGPGWAGQSRKSGGAGPGRAGLSGNQEEVLPFSFIYQWVRGRVLESDTRQVMVLIMSI
jgi:hypothetical protein